MKSNNLLFRSGLLLLTCSILILQSCKKYTEVAPVSQYSIPDAFSDPSNAFNALVGVYDELQGDNGYGIRISMYYPFDTDEAIVSGNIDNGRRGVGRYQLLLTNSEIRIVIQPTLAHQQNLCDNCNLPNLAVHRALLPHESLQNAVNLLGNLIAMIEVLILMV